MDAEGMNRTVGDQFFDLILDIYLNVIDKTAGDLHGVEGVSATTIKRVSRLSGRCWWLMLSVEWPACDGTRSSPRSLVPVHAPQNSNYWGADYRPNS